MKVLVIADDLSGAAEVAGSATRFGLSAEVQIGSLHATKAEVVVVDTDSRSLGPQAAFERVHALTQAAIAFKPDVLFKKVDSLLRGAVLAEATAMRMAAGFSRSLLVCGNPRKKRTVKRGKLYIDGLPLHTTDFAVDPEHPRYTNDAIRLLTQTRNPHESSENAFDSLGVAQPGEGLLARLTIGDVTSRADLNTHAAYWSSNRQATLAVGGAEFFEAILQQVFGVEQHELEHSNFRIDGDTLLISGTRMSQPNDWPVVPCSSQDSPVACAKKVVQVLADRGRAAIRAIDIEDAAPATRVQQIVKVAYHVLKSSGPGQVWIEGGQTASTLIRALDLQRLVAVATPADGVVALRATNRQSPIYLIKPGSYPWGIADNSVTAEPEQQSESKVTANAKQSKAHSTSLLTKLAMALMWCGLLSSANAEQQSFKGIAKILAEQCLDCHNANTREGNVDLERFDSLSDVDQDRALWKTIFDVVEAKQMPLPQSGYELEPSQRQEMLEFIRHALSRADPQLGRNDPGKPVLRRLTRLEYNNTVRDLFGLDYDIFMFPERLPVADKRYFTQNSEDDTLGSVLRTSMREYGQKYDVLLPQLGLPGDNRANHGFANRGDALNFSPLLFEKYLQMAAAIANSERLLRDSPVLQDLFGVDPPPQSAASIENDTVAVRGNFAARERIGSHAPENDTWHGSFVSELTEAFERGSGGTFDVPATLNNQSVAGKGGLIKIQVQGEVLLINPNADLWLAAFATATETSGEHLLTNRNKGEKVFELTFSGQDSFEPCIQHLGVCVLARRNQQGLVKLTAVLSDGQKIVRQSEVNEKSGNVFFSWVAPPGTCIEKLNVDGSQFSGDYVLLDDFGFIFGNQARPMLPATSEQSMEEKQASHGQSSRQERIADFLSRAYRREASPTEIASAEARVLACVESGETELDALRELVQTVLSSPEFLFLAEPMVDRDESVRRLGTFELANRLSYFLWSSMPDAELLRAAESGALDDQKALIEQVRRMLAKRSKSRELSESFAAQWLRLDQLYSSKPDRKLFKSFYSGPQGKSTLHGPMMTEALLLFETVLAEDRSILELYDPDYTWLNRQLAGLYELHEPFEEALSAAVEKGLVPDPLPAKGSGSYWLRTRLLDRNRGGIMTMASTLTLTSLPFRTSPIKRGAWLLETVFNRPPSEPKVAFVLEEATEESGDDSQPPTVRQLFEKHRSDPNCYSCHSRIDPPGFSLEVFDAMGTFRTHDGSQLVDASGEWNGQEFTTPAEFKDAIRVREQELVRGFVEHLLSYALGRELEHFDMQAVDQIVRNASRNDYKFSAIIEGIVLSYPFQHVRNFHESFTNQ